MIFVFKIKVFFFVVVVLLICVNTNHIKINLNLLIMKRSLNDVGLCGSGLIFIFILNILPRMFRNILLIVFFFLT